MSTTVYTWNPLTDSVIEESDGSGNSLCTYTNEPSQFGPLVSENRGGTTSYYHADALGSTRLTTSNTQTVVDSFVFDAWGNTVVSTGSTPTPFLWCGRWGYRSGAVLANINVRNRAFQPSLARWSSVDPLALTLLEPIHGVLVLYAYAKNSPNNALDPTGLQASPSEGPNTQEPFDPDVPPSPIRPDEPLSTLPETFTDDFTSGFRLNFPPTLPNQASYFYFNTAMGFSATGAYLNDVNTGALLTWGGSPTTTRPELPPAPGAGNPIFVPNLTQEQLYELFEHLISLRPLPALWLIPREPIPPVFSMEPPLQLPAFGQIPLMIP